MESLGTPKSWMPYVNIKDCSQGFCSLYCPQWCNIIFPPPPPIFDDFPQENSSSTFSPLIIAIIGILASAFLLVTYYTLISKYCGNYNNGENNVQDHSTNEELGLQDNHNPSLHEPWNVITAGLDEAVIKKITMCKYKKGDGLIDGTDCSVCLCEFEEDESIRLLPKCTHAFHVSCIDTWLKSHSNCPLCRANIVFLNASLSLPLMDEALLENSAAANSWMGSRQVSAANSTAATSERDVSEENTVPQNDHQRVFNDSGNLEEEGDAIIEIGDERHQRIRRSFSMDHPFSIADMLRIDQDHDFLSEEAESSKNSKSGSHRRRRVLHGVTSPVSMKRSFSSGRFFFTRHSRLRDTINSLV